jgi:hypothetical protein
MCTVVLNLVRAVLACCIAVSPTRAFLLVEVDRVAAYMIRMLWMNVCLIDLRTVILHLPARNHDALH